MSSNLDYYRRLWDEIHTNAARVRSRSDHAQFCNWIRNVPYRMNCGKCKQHMIQYIYQNPPERADNAFTWSWEFHNDVNVNVLGKPPFSYVDAAMRYLGWL